MDVVQLDVAWRWLLCCRCTQSTIILARQNYLSSLCQTYVTVNDKYFFLFFFFKIIQPGEIFRKGEYQPTL